MIGALFYDRYQIEAELGQGGMGTVYAGYDTVLQRPVAIKILSKSGLDFDARQRLLHEAQATAQLHGERGG
jgi:serine/threonine-protein kinase